ncbi:MAG: hypothetical protein ACI8WB_001404 [Phenylobacterium sp.]|jgi:hypothetical protein
MQLIKPDASKSATGDKKPRKFTNLTGALAAASCALLGADALAASNAANTNSDDDWKFNTAILYYGESDSRVTAVEGIINANKTFDENEILDLKITVDTLTGASPTGAVPQPGIQTFTRPSGRGNYQVAAGEVPLDDTFHDTRLQLNGQWTQPVGESYLGSFGLHASKEFDYLSLGFNGSVSRDINQKNTTLSAGFAYSHDTIEPEGGRPVPYAAMLISTDELDDNGADEQQNQQHADVFSQSRLGGSGSKDILDLLLGVTQVINRRAIMQFNYSYSTSDGYLTDPFKVVTVVNAQGLAQDHLYENRPDKRTKQSFFWQTKYHFDSTIADVSYRFMTDDWGIDSHTVDSKLRFVFDNDSYLEPHFRIYRQGAADFYRPFLLQSTVLQSPLQPVYASADYRIGEFTAYTVGFKYGIKLNSGNNLAFRLEYYQQDPNNDGFNAPGVLSSYELNPTVKALILQLSYSF